MQIEKLIEAAEELKLATLRAKEQGIFSYHIDYTGKGEFHYSDEKNFAEIIKNRDYAVKNFIHGGYEYTVSIDGMSFFCLSDNLLFEGDENKIMEEV